MNSSTSMELRINASQVLLNSIYIFKKLYNINLESHGNVDFVSDLGSNCLKSSWTEKLSKVKKMCRLFKSVLYMNILFFNYILSAPSVSFVPSRSNDVYDVKLNEFLSEYYDKFIKNSANPVKTTEKTSRNVDIYETMQGDQPVGENTISQNLQGISMNFTNRRDGNLTNPEYVKAMRDM